MTISEIAHRLIELVRAGKDKQAWEELYSSDIVSIESMPNAEEVVGMEALKIKGEKRESMVDTFYGIEVSEPLISDDHFAVTYTMDLAYTGAPRTQETEIAVYEVKDGKIIKEHYIYNTPATE